MLNCTLAVLQRVGKSVVIIHNAAQQTVKTTVTVTKELTI